MIFFQDILGGGRNCVYYECAQCLYDSHCHWDSVGLTRRVSPK